MDVSFLKENLAELVSTGELIRRYSKGNAVFNAHHWTVLKLVFLKLYLQEVYTPIIKKYYENMFYIDFFAGSGLNMFSRIKDVFVPGSPLVAWGFAKKSFDKLFLVEKDEKSCEALEERMELISHPENFDVIPGDANEKCELIMHEVEDTPKSHFFAFIDPIAFEAKWETVRRLLASGVRGDFIILFQTRRIAQNVGNALKGRFKKVEFLNNFFGDNKWINFVRNRGSGTTIEQAVLEYYKNKIRGLEGRDRIVEEIRIMKTIKKPSQLHYHLIFVTNKTASGSPYMQGVYKLKNLVEQGDQKLVDNAILEVLGRQKPLNSYF